MRPVRIRSAQEVRSVTDKYPEHFTYDFESWIADENNYCCRSGENLGFAEFKTPGVFWVHFCFDSARGRAAIDLTKQMLDQLYLDMPVETVIGLIAETNRKARWLIRQVGLKSLGFVDTSNGLCEMFYLTKGKSQNGI